MKKKTVVILAVIAAVILLVIFCVSKYNGFVNSQEGINDARSQVEVQLERRADLIPNFVNTVKGYTEYEKETLTAVTDARASVGKANTVKETEAAQAELNRAIDVWVNAVTEAYPDLKANEQYVALQDELAGSENRIATARKDYNSAAKEYNVSIRRFPSNILASLFGFDKADYFSADASKTEVPQMNF